MTADDHLYIGDTGPSGKVILHQVSSVLKPSADFNEALDRDLASIDHELIPDSRPGGKATLNLYEDPPEGSFLAWLLKYQRMSLPRQIRLRDLGELLEPNEMASVYLYVSGVKAIEDYRRLLVVDHR